MSVSKQKIISGFAGAAMAFGTAFSPAAITAQEISGAQSQDNVQMAALGDEGTRNVAFMDAPYQNGDRVEKSQVRDALNYYDIVFFSGDNIGGLEGIARRLRNNDGINAVALSGWEVSECTIVFNRDTIDHPSAGATFGQGSVDHGLVRNYARDLAGIDNVFSGDGNCINENPRECPIFCV